MEQTNMEVVRISNKKTITLYKHLESGAKAVAKAGFYRNTKKKKLHHKLLRINIFGLAEKLAQRKITHEIQISADFLPV